MCVPKTIDTEYSTYKKIIQIYLRRFEKKLAEFKNASEQLTNFTTKGCFIVCGDTPNVMTASWGFIGVMWGKRVAVVPIRDSRFTKGLIEKNQEFTMNIPYGKLADELKFCGTKSGRDMVKYKECGLKIAKAKKLNTYIVEGCDAYFECRVMQKLTLSGQEISDEIAKQYGENPDYHNFYIAEIVEEY